MTINEVKGRLSKGLLVDLVRAFDLQTLDTPIREEQARIVLYLINYGKVCDQLSRIEDIIKEEQP